MADFKQLIEEKVRLERRISKGKIQIPEAQARLTVVNKEIEEDNRAFIQSVKDKQVWFDQKRP